MARHATPTLESKEVPANPAVIAAEMDAANQLAVIERSRQDIQTQAEQEKDEALAAGIDIGRLEALDFVATVANAAVLPISFQSIFYSPASFLPVCVSVGE